MGKLVKNIYYNLIYQVFNILLPFLLTPYLARRLGAESIGIFSYTNSVVLLFSTFGMLGITTYSNREIAYCATKGKEALSRTFWSLCYIRMLLFVITTVFYGGMLYFSDYKNFFLLQILLLSYYFSDLSWLFVGLGEMRTVVQRNCIVKIISTLFIYLFVKKESDLNWYILINGGGMFIGNILMLPQVTMHVQFARVKFGEIVKHILPMVKLFLPQAASSVYVILDKSMIKWLTEDIKKVGFYDQSQLITKMPLLVVSSLSTVVMPIVAQEYILENEIAIRGYIEKILNVIIVFIFPVSIGIIGISSTFVPCFFGEGYSECVVILKMLAIVIIPISLTNVTGIVYLIACNHTKALTVSYVTASVINILLNGWLIPKIGTYGAAIGTICAEFVVLIIQYKYVMKYIGGFSLFKKSGKPFFSALVMLFFVLWIGRINDCTIKTVVFQIAFGIFAYFIVMIILRDKNMLSYIFQIKNKIEEKRKGKAYE